MFVYSAPLTTRFRGLDTRTGLLVRGPADWAEFSPFWEYDDAEAVAWLRATYEAAYVGFAPARRTHIPVNVTVPATSPERAHTIVTNSNGCLTAKVKVAERGQDVGQEIARLEAVRAALGPAGKIRIDANGGWDTDTALARLKVLDRAAGGLEYVEQPCASVSELALVRRGQGVPVAADESIRRARDPYAVKAAGAADIMVLKVQPLGGVAACLNLAADIGLPVVVSSALESSVGLAAGLALAAALDELPYACGLATAQLLATDVVERPLLPVDGAIEVGPAVPTDASLAACAAPADIAAQWIERFGRVAEVAGLTGKFDEIGKTQ